MKLFGGNKLAGGSASRAEVYGLFIAAIVLVGGGVGGAFAYSASGGFSQGEKPQTIGAGSTSSPVPSEGNSEPTKSDSSIGNNQNGQGNSKGSNKANSQSNSDQQNSSSNQVQEPTAPQGPVDTRIQEPYIGPANTFSYLSQNYICGWDTQALGGFGWGYDPAEPCNRQFEDYIRSNCGIKDPQTGQWSGIVYFQRCDEMESGTLPIAY